MKIRTGFVSNSSSSSFIAFGITLSKDKFSEVLVKWKPELTDDDIEEIFNCFENGVHHPDSLFGFKLCEYITNYDYEEGELHIGFEWDLEYRTPDITKPLVSQCQLDEITDALMEYNLPLPSSTSGTRYN